jgi:hypothetical protein
MPVLKNNNLVGTDDSGKAISGLLSTNPFMLIYLPLGYRSSAALLLNY